MVYMTQRHQYLMFILRILKLLNIITIIIPCIIIWKLYYAHHIYGEFYDLGNWIVIGLFAACYILFAYIYEVYNISFSTVSELTYSQILSLFISNIFLFLIIVLLSRKMPNIIPLLIALFVEVGLAYIWAKVIYAWYFWCRKPQKIILLYDELHYKEYIYQKVDEAKKFFIAGEFHINDVIIHNMEELSGVEAVFLYGVHSHERNIVLKYCIKHGIVVYLLPRIGDVLLEGFKPIHLFHLPVWRGQRYMPHLEFLFLKRAFDIISSAIILLILSPVMILVAYLIHREDGGPIFYKQSRLTKNGKVFNVLKFRSMRVDAEKDGVARLSTGENDNRITSIGRFIRKCRLDELPQLINIIKGDMSVVGPRPERPEIAKIYEEKLPEFSLRLQVKAGLTGVAQVYGKYNTTPYDKLQMDLMYIANPSLLEDIKIIFATIKILFKTDSTEGVKEQVESDS